MRTAEFGLAASSLIVALLAAEGVTRVVHGPPALAEPQVRYAPDPVRRFTLLGPQAGFTGNAPERVDSAGFRVNGVPCDRSRATIALALGDSFTFGLGVVDSATWPAQLEVDLRRRGSDLCVVNAGTTSYGVFQEMDLLLERGLATRPRLVIHALSWNDYQSATPPEPGEPSLLTAEGYFVWDVPPKTVGLFGRAKQWLTRHSTVTALLVGVVHRIRQDELGGGYGAEYAQLLDGRLSPEHWAPVRQFYERLRQLSDSAHFRILVVLLPVSGIMAAKHTSQHPYRLHMRAMLDSLHLAYIDAFDVWSASGLGKSLFLTTGPDAHPSALGYRILGRALADTVIRDSLLDETHGRSRHQLPLSHSKARNSGSAARPL